MKTVLFSLFLVCGVLSAYNVTRARNLAYASGATFGTEAEINSWTCRFCTQYKLTNTKAFSNSILDIFGYTGFSPDDQAVIVAFRSAVSIQNWVVNFDATQVPYPGCSGCQVHQGFYNAFAGVEGYIRAEVQKLLSIYRDAKIYVTGYSLGSALSTLAGLDLHNIFGKVEQLYTFGQPRVGNEAFAEFVTKSISERYRIIHYADIVPHVPPQLPIPYAHFSNEIWYDQAMKTFKQCGAEQFRCSKSVLPTNWNTADHGFSFYITVGS